ncbi:allantoinase AllB [Lapillicoccus jejuensis]|uniref:allantoinase n=1 Tax=Lapillicoccus jejuensis TaxID=402171 RepID=A0A542E4L9_9MICO|nr:allantoinase AllB [Lapillicoccus jejuensis]TQJ10271.1 allantoinase [Lapillicoccus jejuensis]
MSDLVLRARRVVTPRGERAATVVVEDGRITALLPYDAPPPDVAGPPVELADDEVLLPGLVDTHVHVNEPGRTPWEGFTTATRAAARGGVTTIVDMPLNSIPPTTTLAGLRAKQEATTGQTWVDVGFWGGAVPGTTADLGPLHEAGVFGFKCFLLPSGVDEFPPLDASGLATALAEVAQLGSLMVVHAEDHDAIEHAPAPSGPQYAGFLRSRPRDAEDLAIRRLVDLARATGARVHVLHLSSSDALPIVRAAKAEGLALTAETCPHYLTFSAEEVPAGATQFKCCPPIREAGNRESLWAGLADGTVDLVVTDHSPCTPDLKHLDTGDFGTAWGGIASLQLGLAAVWTGARARGHSLTDVVRWMAQAPAQQAGLLRKGAVEVGRDADLVVLAPDETFVVDPARLEHRNKVTAYAGRELTGVVRRTYLAGREVDLDAPPRGRLLRRGD